MLQGSRFEKGKYFFGEEKEKIPAEGLVLGGGGRGPLFTLGLGKGWAPNFLHCILGLLPPLSTSTSTPWLSLLFHLGQPILNTILSKDNPLCGLLSLILFSLIALPDLRWTMTSA